MDQEILYDVALSFAGEDRPYVGRVAALLRDKQVRVFYDEYHKVSLWGVDLYTHLQDVYRKRARYTVMFISTHYATKLWSNHERQAAQSRALEENQEYILPARFDNTEVPGLNSTIGYVDISGMDPEDLTDLIIQKISQSQKAASTELERLTNQKLKQMTLELVVEIRGKLQKHQLEMNSLIHSNLGYSTMSEDERSTAWNKRNEDMGRISGELMSAYDRECKVSAFLFRDELLFRLPAIDRDKHVDYIYEHPTNPLGVGNVTDDLEMLARILPDDA